MFNLLPWRGVADIPPSDYGGHGEVGKRGRYASVQPAGAARGVKISLSFLESAAPQAVNEAAIRRFVTQTNTWVRVGVATNLNLDEGLLEALARDECLSVRAAIAKNPKTPLRILEGLVRDREPYVAVSALANPKMLPFLQQLADDEDSSIRGYVAQYVNTPEDVLEKLIQDTHPIVRTRAIQNLDRSNDFPNQFGDIG